jgi:putative ABC transport system permease protein
VAGVVFGLAIGGAFTLDLGIPFLLGWEAVVLGLVVAAAVGGLFGLYPAVKASRLNP